MPQDARAADASASDSGANDAGWLTRDPLPARAFFLGNAEVALGDGYDLDESRYVSDCVRGVVTLNRNSRASTGTDREPAWSSVLLGLVGRSTTLRETPELNQFFDEIARPPHVSVGQYTAVDWGAAGLSQPVAAPDAAERCPSLFVWSAALGIRSWSRIDIEFDDDEALREFTNTFGTLADLLALSNDVVTATGQALARHARARLSHLQVGGDRARTEALLASHRCSITALRECERTMAALHMLGDVADPQPDDFGSWEILSAELTRRP